MGKYPNPLSNIKILKMAGTSFDINNGANQIAPKQ